MEEYAYIEILIEDQSGEILVKNIMDKYITEVPGITYKIHSFKGIGKIPKKVNKLSQAKMPLLRKYVQDSIVGTWEYLADVVYSGGVNALKKKAESYYEIGLFKCECAGNIGMYLNIHENKSPSFNYFINKLNDFCEV